MPSIGKCGVYLILWIGLINLAGAEEAVIINNEVGSFHKFAQWCINTKQLMEFCEGDNCKEGLTKDKSCELVLPFDAVALSYVQQRNACNYYSPYVISEANGSKSGDLYCKFDTTHYCPENDAAQVEHRCYRLGTKPLPKNTKLSELAKSCPDGYSVTAKINPKARMWISILMENDHKHNPLWITDGTDRALALSTRSDGMNNVEIGDIYEPNDNVELKTLCVKNAVPIPPIDRYATKYTGDYAEYFITNNVYQPEYDAKSKKMNIDKYHEICEKIFPFSMAANPNDYARIKKDKSINGQILHVAARIGDSISDVPCKASGEQNNPINVRHRYKAFNKEIDQDKVVTYKLGDIDAKIYATRKYPNNNCADKPRTILTMYKNDAGKLNGVVDEPSFARHPLLCIRGASPTGFAKDTEQVPRPPAPRKPAPSPSRPAPSPSRPASNPSPPSFGGGSFGRSKNYKCPPGWAMSRRPSPYTKPWCFKVFDSPAHVKGYDANKLFCSEKGGELASQEYSSDVEALMQTLPSGAANNEVFSAFILGKNKCLVSPETPCERKEFVWDYIVPVNFTSRPLDLWHKPNDPNMMSQATPGDQNCTGIEKCVFWHHAGPSIDVWLDVLCDCRGLPNQYQSTKAACMREADEYECQPGWATSYRSKLELGTTIPETYCFKAFKVSKKLSWQESRDYCSNHHSAQMASQENQMDYDALLSTISEIAPWNGFLAGQNTCPTLEQGVCSTPPQFEWYTMDNKKTAVVNGLSLWSQYYIDDQGNRVEDVNPSQTDYKEYIGYKQGQCPTREACVWFQKKSNHNGDKPHWLDVHCSCNHTPTHVFCMKKPNEAIYN